MSNITTNTRKALASEWLLDALLANEPKEVIDYLCKKADKQRQSKISLAPALQEKLSARRSRRKTPATGFNDSY